MQKRCDNTYRDVLSRIRIGSITDSDINVLQSRKIHFKGSNCDERLNKLCTYMNQLPVDTRCLLPTCLVNETICNVIAVNRSVDGNRINSIKIVISDNKEGNCNECKGTVLKKRINAVPTNTVTINKKKYKVISAIFHESEKMNRGHYTCMLRWSKGAQETYILFLDQIK
ncbi:hypothetical protein ALC56_05568 [Trachymyrmex septentrionalis]|uniref:USP domain-containing protein n=1 Tax=Trachymyrmex septentrionalis TaxID=34720 RepID=A0A151JXV2_9HYME|nr:hypothetical protein ALC56_05568 [Trachymyrmex septentrionalis]